MDTSTNNRQKDNTSVQEGSIGLREQEAPEKNTDKAFVKVKEDGSPGMGSSDENSEAGAQAAEPKK